MVLESPVVIIFPVEEGKLRTWPVDVDIDDTFIVPEDVIDATDKFPEVVIDPVEFIDATDRLPEAVMDRTFKFPLEFIFAADIFPLTLIFAADRFPVIDIFGTDKLPEEFIDDTDKLPVNTMLSAYTLPLMPAPPDNNKAPVTLLVLTNVFVDTN
jgi:hypothetical protein